MEFSGVKDDAFSMDKKRMLGKELAAVQQVAKESTLTSSQVTISCKESESRIIRFGLPPIARAVADWTAAADSNAALQSLPNSILTTFQVHTTSQTQQSKRRKKGYVHLRRTHLTFIPNAPSSREECES